MWRLKVDQRPRALLPLAAYSSNYFQFFWLAPASAVEPMFWPGAPDRYSGTDTVIWDSEV